MCYNHGSVNQIWKLCNIVYDYLFISIKPSLSSGSSCTLSNMKRTGVQMLLGIP